GNRPAVGHAVTLVDADPARAAALDELVAEPALSHPGLGHDADRLRLPVGRAGKRPLEHGQLVVAADEARETTRPRGLQPAAQRARAPELVDAQRLENALHVERPEVAEANVARDEGGRVRREIRPAGVRELLHSLR